MDKISKLIHIHIRTRIINFCTFRKIYVFGLRVILFAHSWSVICFTGKTKNFLVERAIINHQCTTNWRQNIIRSLFLFKVHKRYCENDILSRVKGPRKSKGSWFFFDTAKFFDRNIPFFLFHSLRVNWSHEIEKCK